MGRGTSASFLRRADGLDPHTLPPVDRCNRYSTTASSSRVVPPIAARRQPFRPKAVSSAARDPDHEPLARPFARPPQSRLPVILVEVESSHQDAVTLLLHHHGYRLFDRDRRDGSQLARAAFNTLALPPDT